MEPLFPFSVHIQCMERDNILFIWIWRATRLGNTKDSSIVDGL